MRPDLRIRRPRWLAAIAASAIALGGLVAATPASAAPLVPTAAGSAVDVCTTGAEVLSEDFSSGSVPAGWTARGGSWSVADGRLVGTGTRYGNAERIITDLPHLDAYCLEMTMQFDAAVNSGSWAGPILDIAPDATAGPWQHALVRQGGGTAFGTSGAADSSWEGDIVGPGQPAFAAGEDITFTVVVDGTHGEMWIGRDGAAPVKIHETDALKRTSDGTVGLILDGATVEYDDIVVTDLSALPTADDVVVSEDFSGGEIPAGWNGISGDWSVQDGRIVGTSAAYSSGRLVFGDSLPEYRFDATVRFESVASSNRWAGLVLDIPEDGSNPWQHALMRANNAPVGFGYRTPSDSWATDILGASAPAEAPIAVGTDIRMTVVVRGTHGEWWYQSGAMTAPVKLAETDALNRGERGSLGLIVDGATVSFDDIVVTDLNPTASACIAEWNAVEAAAAAAGIDEVAFAQDFSDASAIDCWTDVSDSWDVANGELVGSTASAADTAALTFGPHLADYRFDATVRVDEAADGAWLAFGGDVARDGSGSWIDDRLPLADLGTVTRDVSVEVHARAATISVDGTPVRQLVLDRSSTGILGLAVGGATVAVDDVALTKLEALPLACIPQDRPAGPGNTGLVVAHRGNDGNDGIGDNLIPGYARSVAVGADSWESDIHITTDGVPVVRHDGFGAMTLAQFQAAFPGLPTLAEVLEFQRDSRSQHVLEYKGSWSQEQAAVVRDLLIEYGVWETTVSQSFDLNTLDSIRAVDAEMPIMWLTGSVTTDSPRIAAEHDLYGINPNQHPSPEAVQAMHDAGYKIFVWTQNSAAQWDALTRLGVDGIITDWTGALVDWNAEYNAQLGLETCRDVTVEVSGEGTAAASVERAAEGDTVTLTAEPSVGWHLEGWAADVPGELAIVDGAFTMPRQPVWVDAEFAPNAYTVAYDVNGGSGEIAATSHTFGDGSALTGEAPVRDGHEFLGWATDPEGEVAYAAGAVTEGLVADHGATVTLYAVWQHVELDAPKPIITGQVKPGAKLVADAGAWTDGAELTFQWLAEGEPIAGETTERFHLVGKWKGQDITVQVTGSLDGYEDRTVESEPIRID